MFYLDASAVVAMFTNEARTTDVQEWARGHAPLAISDWVTVEFRSAVAAKGRIGDLDEGLRQQALDAYQAARRTAFISFDIDTSVFGQAAKLAGNVKAALRAGDALHLAIAIEHGAVLATLDRRQVETGALLGVRTLLL